MTDNATTKDAAGIDVLFRTRERSGVHTAVQQAAFQDDDGTEQVVRPGKPLPSADAIAAAKLDALIAAIMSTVVNGKQLVGGARDKWRDDFISFDTVNAWTPSIHAADRTRIDGTDYGSSFLALTKSGLTNYTESSILSKRMNALPVRYGFGLSLSQRVDGEVYLLEMVEVDDGGALVLDGSGDSQTFNPVDILSGQIATVVVASNVATIYFNTDHPYKMDDHIVLWGNTDTRINAFSRVTGVINRRAITCALTAANATYIAGGNCARVDFSAGSRNAGSLIIFGTASANAQYLVKGQGATEFVSAPASLGTSWSDPLIPSTQNWQIGLQPRFQTEILATLDACKFGASSTDSNAIGTWYKRSQAIPNPAANYALRIRAITLPNKATPIGIVSATKAAGTTATVVTDGPHGLVTGQMVKAYGPVDQANWANVTTETAVTVIDPVTLTLTWGASVTATIYGGMLMPSNANQTTGAKSFAVRGTTWRNGRLWVATNAAMSGVARGDTVRLVNCREAGGAGLRANVAQRYRVIALDPNVCETASLASGTATNTSPTLALTDTAAVPVGALLSGTGFAAVAVNAVTAGVSLTMASNASASGTSPYTMYGMVLEPLDASAPADIQPAAALSGGAILLETDLRLNFVRCLDYTRTPVEVTGGHVTQDQALGIPCVVLNQISSINQGSRATVGSGWYVEPDNTVFADVASAAITTTTTTSAITPTPVGAAAEFNVPVTAVGGTTPTLDISIEESDDTATNWYPIYQFPRITATGMYRTPLLLLTGNRLRYVQTISGSGATFTRAINRITHQMITPAPLRQIIDRTISLTTLNSTTPTLKTNGAKNVQLVLNLGAATTPPAIQIEGSDDNGLTWYAIGAPLTGVASATVQLTVNNIHAEMVRGRVSTIGATVTAGYTLLKAFG